nr:reverse transcriptase, RNA-dependent DNA polymerase, Gag-polypeptide of LTR copia-type [Tanacetum cinerariifolium]
HEADTKLSTVYYLVAEDEQQHMIIASKKPVCEVAAFQASFQGRLDQTRKQQEKGWTKKKNGSRVNKTKQCYECGRDGHNKDVRFKIIGYLKWWPGQGKKDKPRPRAAMAKTKPCPILGMTKKKYAMFLKLFGENREEPMIDNMSDLEAGNLIGASDCRDGLYWMGGIKEERKEMGFTIDAWNKRLGHASNIKLSRVSFLRDVSSSFNAKSLRFM